MYTLDPQYSQKAYAAATQVSTTFMQYIKKNTTSTSN